MANAESMPEELQVLTPEHEPIALSTLWAASPVLLVLVRHFG